MRPLMPLLLLITAGLATSACAPDMSGHVARSSRVTLLDVRDLSEDERQRGVILSFLSSELGQDAFDIDVSVSGGDVVLTGEAHSVTAHQLAPILVSNLRSVTSVDGSQLSGPRVRKDPFNPSLEQRLRDALAREFGADRGFEIIVVDRHAVIRGMVATTMDLFAVDAAVNEVDGLERVSLQIDVAERRRIASID